MRPAPDFLQDSTATPTGAYRYDMAEGLRLIGTQASLVFSRRA
jgi:hypothetical protein